MSWLIWNRSRGRDVVEPSPPFFSLFISLSHSLFLSLSHSLFLSLSLYLSLFLSLSPPPPFFFCLKKMYWIKTRGITPHFSSSPWLAAAPSTQSCRRWKPPMLSSSVTSTYWPNPNLFLMWRGGGVQTCFLYSILSLEYVTSTILQPPWWDAVLQKLLAWALFVFIFLTLVRFPNACQQSYFGNCFFFFFHNCPFYPPPPSPHTHVSNNSIQFIHPNSEVTEGTVDNRRLWGMLGLSSSQ